jgi:hypothetical protein
MADVEIRLKFIRENIAAFKQTIDEIQSLNTAANKPLKADARNLIAELKKVKDEAQKAGDELEKLASKRIKKPKVDAVQDAATSPTVQNNVAPITRSIKEAADFANAEVAKLKAQAKAAAEDILKTIVGAEVQAAQLRLQASSNPIKAAADLANKEAALSKATAARIVEVAQFNASTAVLNAKDIAASQQALAISAKAALENNSLLGRFRSLKAESEKILSSIRVNFNKVVAEEKIALGKPSTTIQTPLASPQQASGSGAAATVKGFVGATIIIEAFSAAIQAARQQFKNFIDTGDELALLSDKTGIAVEKLSALKFAADQNDTSLNALSSGFKFLSLALTKAGADSGPAAAALQALGLDAEKLKNAGLDEAFLQIATEIKTLKLESEQIAITQAIFGRGGESLIPLLKQGEDGIKKFTDRAKELNIVTSEDSARGADKLRDRFKEFQAITEADFGRGFAAALPELNKFQDKLLELRGTARDDGGLFGDIFKTGAGFATDILTITGETKNLIEKIQAIENPFDKYFDTAEKTNVALGNAKTEIGFIKSAFNLAQLAVAGINDVVIGLGGLIELTGGLIGNFVTAPLLIATELLGQLIKKVNAEVGQSIIDFGKSSFDLTEGFRKTGAEALLAEADISKLYKTLKDASKVKIDPSIPQVLQGDGLRGGALDRTPQPEKPKRVTGFTGLFEKDAKDKKEKDTLASRIALQRAELEAEFSKLEASIKASNRVIDDGFAAGLISIADAYSARLVLIGAQSKAQRELLEKEAETLRNGIEEAISKKDLVKENMLKAQLVKVEAQLSIQDLSLQESKDTLKKWKKDQEANLKDIRVGIALDFAELSGKFDADAFIANTQKQFSGKRIVLQTELASAQQKGEVDNTIKLENDLRLLDIKERTVIAQGRFNAALEDQDRISQAADRELAKVQEQVQAGKLGDIEASLQIEAIQARLIANLDPIREKLNEASQAFPREAARNIEEAGIRVDELGRKIAQAQPQILSIGQVFSNVFQNQIGGAISNAILGVTSLKDAIINMIKQAVAQIIASNVIKILGQLAKAAGFSSGGSVPGGVSPIPTDASAAAGYYAEGGHIRGRGTETSDSIPAWLSHNEYVIPANRVRQYGVGFFDAIRKGLIKNVPAAYNNLAKTSQSIKNSTATLGRYAAGGLAQASGLSVQLVNNGTPQQVVSQDFDLQAMVVRIVTEDVKRGGVINSAIENSGRRRR